MKKVNDNNSKHYRRVVERDSFHGETPAETREAAHKGETQRTTEPVIKGLARENQQQKLGEKKEKESEHRWKDRKESTRRRL